MPLRSGFLAINEKLVDLRALWQISGLLMNLTEEALVDNRISTHNPLQS